MDALPVTLTSLEVFTRICFFEIKKLDLFQDATEQSIWFKALSRLILHDFFSYPGSLSHLLFETTQFIKVQI
jgi:hypothetical protein